MYPSTRQVKVLLGTLIAGLLLLPGGTHAEPGALTQLPGEAGCISQDGSGPCTKGDLLDGAFAVAASNDGNDVYAALIDARAVAAFARDKRTGALTQLPSPLGCISQTGNGGLCAQGRGLVAPFALAVSPNGKNVYVASFQSDPVALSSVAVFARDRRTGALTQLADTQGCISEELDISVCTRGIALRGAESVAVSNDGKHVYVASAISSGVAVFARDDRTGALTQLPEPDGCITKDGRGGHCTTGRALDGARSVAVSGDGAHVYVASQRSNAVAVFARDRRTGVLTQLPGEAGCISDDGTDGVAGPCVDGTGLGDPTMLAVSPNGKNVYVTSAGTDELAVLVRDRRTGALGPGICLQDEGGIVCDTAFALDQPFSVAVSPDSRRVYVTARDSDSVAVFAQDEELQTLDQLPSPGGCISDDGTGGLCTTGRALNDPRSVFVTKDRKHVYVASQGSKAVAVLQREK